MIGGWKKFDADDGAESENAPKLLLDKEGWISIG